jgi:hypothetical protein
MKKITLFVVPVLAVALLVFPNNVRAGGPVDAIIEFSPSPASAPADGQTAITMSVHAYDYKCSAPDTYGFYHESTDPNYCAANGYGTASVNNLNLSGLSATVSGGGNTLSPSSFSLDSSGRTSFTVKSTVAESKVITIYGYSGSYSYATTSVTFTSPAAAPTPASTGTPKKTTTTTPAPVSVAPPVAPALATVKVDGTQADIAHSITFDEAKPLVLSGTTVPNGVVTLAIHSTPKTVTTTADKDGHWSYTVNGLEPGDHYVEATVTDPATNKTSDSAKLLSFKLTAHKTPAVAHATPASKKQSYVPLIVGLAVVVVALLGSATWFLWRRLKFYNRPL